MAKNRTNLAPVLAGLAAGAALGAAAGAAMASEKTRKRARKVANVAFHEIRRSAGEITEQAQGRLNRGKRMIKGR